MEALLDLADALAAQSETPPRPDFPLTGELARWADPSYSQELLVCRDSSHGKGWFTRETIPGGTILMVAKPLAMAMDWENDDDDNDDDMQNEENEDDDSAMKDDHADKEPKLNSLLVNRLLQDILKSPDLWTNCLSQLFPRTKEDVAQLPTFSPCRDTTLQQERASILENLKQQQSQFTSKLVEEMATRLPLIVRYNVLSVETCPELLSHPGPNGHATLGGVGLYYWPSFFNHSSTPNVARFAVGDVLWLVANQSIPKGHEACISYIEHDVLCENANRRTIMLQMDFQDDHNNASQQQQQQQQQQQDDENDEEDDGPDLPVVDSDVQNELMEMDPLERLTAIEELLQQAQGKPPPHDGDDDDDDEDNNNNNNNSNSINREDVVMEESSPSSGWFQCDIQNLRILKAITLEGLGQSAQALVLWEDCVVFSETRLPPLDENSIVMRVQAALCAHYLATTTTTTTHSNKTQGDSTTTTMMNKARQHATKALETHDKLFGGGAARLRRRFKNDFTLALRGSGGKANVTSAVDLLWPLSTTLS